MAINRVKITNLTVFNDIEIDLIKGINVFIGENGTGKTHLLKVLYSACEIGKTTPNVLKVGEFFMSGNFDVTNTYNSLEKLKDLISTAKEELEIIVSSDESDFFYRLNSKDALSISPTDSSWYKIFAEKEAVFIPATEVLSHSKGFVQLYQENEIAFDKIYYDLVNKAQRVFKKKENKMLEEVINTLSDLIDGAVIVEGNEFFVKKSSGQLVPFSLEAEGLRKLASLWTLIRNGTITNNSILLWDEPESNINPKFISVIVDVLLELSRQGVQVFIATHDYVLAKYFEVKREKTDVILFHSLFKGSNGVECETNENFRDLKNNAITASFDKLLDEVYFAHIED